MRVLEGGCTELGPEARQRLVHGATRYFGTHYAEPIRIDAVATRLGVGLAVISAAFAWVLARGLAGEQIATYAAASAVVMLLVWVALPRQHAA
jgi:hypothetical protein